MERGKSERRQIKPDGTRAPFGDLARTVLRGRVSGARAHGVHWVSGPTLTWARWAREDGRHVFYAVRRRADWVTGEIGASHTPLELEALPLVRDLAGAPRGGCRIQLGHLLHGHDRWWSAGGNEGTLIVRIEWLADQMQLAMSSFLSSAIDPAA